jgi:hypothetical protein
MMERSRLLLREHNHLARTLGEALEHTVRIARLRSRLHLVC